MSDATESGNGAPLRGPAATDSNLRGAGALVRLRVRHPARHIFEHDPQTLRDWCADQGMPPYRAEQILDWVYRKRVAKPDGMSNLSKGDRAALARAMTFLSGSVVRHQVASDGTQKLLVEWDEPATETEATEGGNRAGHGNPGRIEAVPASLPLLGGGAPGAGQPRTECVMIPFEDRITACISSQVGCPVGCRFCASGIGGLEGNLSAGRIVEQVWRLDQLASAVETEASAPPRTRRGYAPLDFDALGPDSVSGARPARVTNVVFMGMGEPLANLANVVKAVRTICAPWGLGLSARKVTISTVGLPRAIERLAEQLELPVTLALSLHAPDDELRRRLIPWAQYTTIADLLAACRRWFEKTGREITLEYTLLGGVNDRPEQAEALATVSRSLRANVNLIRYNEVPGLEFKRPGREDVLEFQRLLRARGVNAHIRRSRGRDIAAACGQLRHEARTA